MSAATSSAAVTSLIPLHRAVDLPDGDRPQQMEKVAFRPFSDLNELDPDPEWLWEGYLAEGVVTMLAGDAFTGKSSLVGGLLAALEQGEPFLGRETRRASAILLTEESRVILRSRAKELGLAELRSSYLGREGIFGVPWRVLIERAAEHALAAGHKLLVVDTFTGLAGLGPKEENDAGAIAERLRPLQRAAGKELAVLFLHHTNKLSQQPRGSGAFRGLADISLRFLRKRDASMFRLQTESRFRTVPLLAAKRVVMPGGWSYQVLGAGEKPGPTLATSTDERLWQALKEAGPEGLTYAEIGQIDGLSEDMAKKRFPKWKQEDKVDHHGKGTKNDPLRWFIR
jgi:hypothetical protein